MIGGATFGQMARYGVIGLGSNAVLFFAYLVLTSVGVESKVAMTCLYALGVAQTFYLNKRWSFRHDGTHGAALVRYCLSYVLGYVVNLLALMVFVDWLGHPHQIVQGALVLALAVMLFLLQKFWVFRPNSSLPATTGPSL